jgi:hypothetical protein
MENSGKQNPKMGFKSPPEQSGPPKGHALKYFLRASQPCLNIISLSRPAGLSKNDSCRVLSNESMHFPPRNARMRQR